MKRKTKRVKVAGWVWCIGKDAIADCFHPGSVKPKPRTFTDEDGVSRDCVGRWVAVVFA